MMILTDSKTLRDVIIFPVDARAEGVGPAAELGACERLFEVVEARCSSRPRASAPPPRPSRPLWVKRTVVTPSASSKSSSISVRRVSPSQIQVKARRSGGRSRCSGRRRRTRRPCAGSRMTTRTAPPTRRSTSASVVSQSCSACHQRRITSSLVQASKTASAGAWKVRSMRSVVSSLIARAPAGVAGAAISQARATSRPAPAPASDGSSSSSGTPPTWRAITSSRRAARRRSRGRLEDGRSSYSSWRFHHP